MTIRQKIDMALAYKGMSQRELAEKLGTSPANLNLKLKRETLKLSDLEKIATALDGTYNFGFEFPDGTKI